MGSIKSIFKRRTVKLITSFYDPLIPTQIGNQNIKIPLSHALRENLIVHPNINFNLARIVKYTEERTKNVKVIDIGANIGDTVAYIRNYSNAPVLCIDGNEKYLSILRQNIVQYSDISVCQTLVGSETKETNIELKHERGTAFIVQSDTKNSVRTLQDILNDFPAFQDSKILKIDTDGYDGLILRGCTNYLRKSNPILFFEFDPYLFTTNNDDPFTLIPYLKDCGYRYLIFYMSNGDYLVSCDIEKDFAIINELVHYFSGRNVTLYTDICAFAEKDKEIFDYTVKQEIQCFRTVRKY